MRNEAALTNMKKNDSIMKTSQNTFLSKWRKIAVVHFWYSADDDILSSWVIKKPLALFFPLKKKKKFP